MPHARYAVLLAAATLTVTSAPAFAAPTPRTISLRQARAKTVNVVRDVRAIYDPFMLDPFKVGHGRRVGPRTARVPYVLYLSDGRRLRCSLIVILQHSRNLGWYLGWKVPAKPDPDKVAVGVVYPKDVIPGEETGLRFTAGRAWKRAG